MPKKYEITKPQPRWKRCPRCERDGFRPPWQGYCYDCQNAYYKERRDSMKAERLAFERQTELETWHEQQINLALTRGLSPTSIELTDPPWWSEED